MVYGVSRTFYLTLYFFPDLVILICSERRNKSEDILVKLFGIGIYNAILGNDRSASEVCKLINRPRSKKEAKIYYKKICF